MPHAQVLQPARRIGSTAAAALGIAPPKGATAASTSTVTASAVESQGAQLAKRRHDAVVSNLTARKVCASSSIVPVVYHTTPSVSICKVVLQYRLHFIRFEGY